MTDLKQKPNCVYLSFSEKLLREEMSKGSSEVKLDRKSRTTFEEKDKKIIVGRIKSLEGVREDLQE